MQSFITRLKSLLIFPALVAAVTAICAAQEQKPPASTGDAASIQQIEALIGQYAQSVNTLDLDLARKIWSSAPEASFIHPRGTEYGLDSILNNFFAKTMGTFSERELLPDRADIHVYGDAAWSEFTWTFHATVKNGGPKITTQGRETQVYHRENGKWQIVHVHYSGMPDTRELKGF
jgi:ketosteroid isomerase-like protein